MKSIAQMQIGLQRSAQGLLWSTSKGSTVGLLLLLGGCMGIWGPADEYGVYLIYGAIGYYDSADPNEGVTRGREIIDAYESNIRPLDVPIGGPAIFVAPTRELYEIKAREDRDNPSSAVLNSLLLMRDNAPPPEYLADFLEYSFLSVPRRIEKRNVFSSMEIVRADTADGIAPPPGGYLLWLDQRDYRYTDRRRKPALHVMAACEEEWTVLNELEFYLTLTFERESSFYAVRWRLEPFVREHPPLC